MIFCVVFIIVLIILFFLLRFCLFWVVIVWGRVCLFFWIVSFFGSRVRLFRLVLCFEYCSVWRRELWMSDDIFFI